VRQAIPCSAVYVQRALGAPDGQSACFDMNATCLSFVFALQHAAHLVAAGVYKNVLIVSSERGTYSRSPKQWESAVLFGDGAAAAVVTAAQPGESSAIWHSHFVTYSSGAELTQLLGAGTLHHPNDPATTPAMNTFDMRGPELLVMAARLLPGFLDSFCQQLGWNKLDFDLVVPHQASGQGLRLLERCGIPHEKVYNHLLERGNCIAASIPLALAEAVEAGRIRRGDKILLLGTSAGISLGALALTF
jgi:3-oxoacyl-[acyl-carrier-protein] synthase-3